MNIKPRNLDRSFCALLCLPIYLTLAFALISCNARKNITPSVLVIAVDQLSAQDLDCGREVKSDLKGENKSEQKIKSATPPTSPSGIDLLCQASYRFAHAYTSSLMSAPALATVLTGQYPVAHAVHDNGTTLSPQIETVAERAFAKNYDTSFFSGGAPILRKTGLHQGFSLFEDSIKISTSSLHRPLKQSVSLFKSRLKEIGREPFLTFFYVPDLRFIQQPTTNALGEPRNLSFESQLEELDSSLSELISILKSEGRWDSTQIILTGLNGRATVNRKSLALPTNLHSENSQVALLWKPAEQHLTQSTIVNAPVNLSDVGTTLFQWIDGRPVQSELPEFKNTPLTNVIQSAANPEVNDQTAAQRWLITESAWTTWRLGRPIQFSLRRGHLHCLSEVTDKEKLKCYNTLIDKDEVFELADSDSSSKEAQALISRINMRYQVKNLSSVDTRAPSLKKTDFRGTACFDSFKNQSFEKNDTSKCDETILIDLYHWLASDKNPQVEVQTKESNKKRFLRSLNYENIDRKVVAAQVQNDWIWDVPTSLMVAQSPLEQIFEIPELTKVRTQLYRALNQSHED